MPTPQPSADQPHLRLLSADEFIHLPLPPVWGRPIVIALTRDHRRQLRDAGAPGEVWLVDELEEYLPALRRARDAAEAREEAEEDARERREGS